MMACEDSPEWIDVNDDAFQKSQGNYLDWAKSYDEVTGLTGWTGPSKVAGVTADCFSPEQRERVRILDVGAGTGLVAKQLKKRGFRHIDALEPSEAMLNEAKKDGVYENYIIDFLSVSPSSIPDDSYDALTGSGIFAKGHVPCEAIHEMTRLVKPGGFIVLAISEDFLSVTKTAYSRLEPLMDELESDKKWKKISSEVFPDYYGSENGRVWCFQVL